MASKWTILSGGAILALFVGAVAVLDSGGISSADEGPPEASAERPGSVLAIAIGQLNEDDGESATVDLRANERGRRDQGTFRFFSEEHGYYNGGVRDMTCVDGVITAKGGGGLIQPDGTRIAVVYTATFDSNTGASSVTVKGKDGFEYTMTGEVDGLTWCGDPTEAPPTF